MTWTDEIGPWDFTPSVVKNQYNEGNLISDSTDPIWSTAHTGVPITDTHDPCGYWPLGYSEPVVPTEFTTELSSCGKNSNDQLDRVAVGAESTTLALIDTDITVYGFSIGENNCIVIKESDRTLYGVGSGGYYCFGDGNDATRTSMEQISAESYKMVAVSDHNHTMAIRTDGTLWGCGYNDRGQLGLGIGSDNPTTNWTQVGSANNWTFVAVGPYQSMMINSSGEMWCCGYISGGADLFGLGKTSAISYWEPTQCGILDGESSPSTGWTSVHLKSGAHSFAMKGSTVYACGYNGYYNLGLGDNISINKFKTVGIYSKAVSGYLNFSLFLDSAGVLYGCGRNNYGQLGTGDTVTVEEITSLGSGFSDIDTGFYFSMGIKEIGGEILGTGLNHYGQLGLGHDTSPVLVWTVAVAESGFSSVDCGSYHTYAGKAIAL